MARNSDKAGISILEKGTAWLDEIGDRMNSLPLLRLLADGYHVHGLITEGLGTIEKALAVSRETEMIFEEPELWRLKSELLLGISRNNTAEAENCLMKAIDIASAHGTKMWELRATMSLARLYQQQERLEDARCRLNTIYSWFNEGLETPDLIRAKKFIDEICTHT